jgi:hypothetical protein
MAEGDHDPILSSPPYERKVEFQHIVQSYGCLCFVRKTMGQDILSACGQIAVLQQSLSENEKRDDIEDILLLDMTITVDQLGIHSNEGLLREIFPQKYLESLSLLTMDYTHYGNPN